MAFPHLYRLPKVAKGLEVRVRVEGVGMHLAARHPVDQSLVSTIPRVFAAWIGVDGRNLSGRPIRDPERVDHTPPPGQKTYVTKIRAQTMQELLEPAKPLLATPCPDGVPVFVAFTVDDVMGSSLTRAEDPMEEVA